MWPAPVFHMAGEAGFLLSLPLDTAVNLHPVHGGPAGLHTVLGPKYTLSQCFHTQPISYCCTQNDGIIFSEILLVLGKT